MIPIPTTRSPEVLAPPERALPPAGTARAPFRCGIDLVEVERIARLGGEDPGPVLAKIFDAREIADSRAVRFPERDLAERFAVKEACLKLFPDEAASFELGVEDIRSWRGAGGRLQLEPGDRLRQVMGRHGVGRIAISSACCRTQACAIAVVAEGVGVQDPPLPLAPASLAPVGKPIPSPLGPPPPPVQEDLARAVAMVRALRPTLLGRLIHRLAPIRRAVVLANMRRVFGGALSPDAYRRLAQAFYGHMGLFLLESVVYALQPLRRVARSVRVENMDIPLEAAKQGKGLIILTGHFGNWEITSTAGILRFPEYRGKFHFLRRPISMRWIESLVLQRFRKAGLEVVPKRNSLLTILDLLERNEALVFIMDQHASVPKDGIPVEFFGQKAGTFRSIALIAKASGAPVVPAHGWREGPGRHVLRFEAPVSWIGRDDPAEEVRVNTRAYNAALERMILSHPEQWFWMHRRWKLPPVAPGGPG